MILHGFTTEEALNLADQVAASDFPDEFVANARQLKGTKYELTYSLPGLPVCWKCTVKHVGQAVGFAAEVDKYPERIACVIGELGHAYRECPDKSQARDIQNAYQHILDTGGIPDLTKVLRGVVDHWLKSLRAAK